MIPVDQLAVFIAAGLALNLTPGPDLLYIVPTRGDFALQIVVLGLIFIANGTWVCLLAALAAAAARQWLLTRGGHVRWLSRPRTGVLVVLGLNLALSPCTLASCHSGFGDRFPAASGAR